MKSTAARCSIGIGLALMLALVIAYGAGGAPMFAAKPTSVATVNLAVVLEKLEQRADADVNLRAMGAAMSKEDEQKVAELTKMVEQLKALPEGKEKVDLQEQAQFTEYKYKAWRNFSQNKVDIENALLLKNLYMAIKAEAKLMALANGYDLVLVDDSQGEIKYTPESQVPRMSQVLQQITARRLLYADKAIDVTDALIARMNNAYRAAGPAKPK